MGTADSWYVAGAPETPRTVARLKSVLARDVMAKPSDKDTGTGFFQVAS
jgi:hypothetical protein